MISRRDFVTSLVVTPLIRVLDSSSFIHSMSYIENIYVDEDDPKVRRLKPIEDSHLYIKDGHALGYKTGIVTIYFQKFESYDEMFTLIQERILTQLNNPNIRIYHLIHTELVCAIIGTGEKNG